MADYSPAPGTPQTGYKAYGAAGLAALTAFLAFWIGDDDPFTKKDAGEALLAAIAAAFPTGLGTYFIKNRPTR